MPRGSRWAFLSQFSAKKVCSGVGLLNGGYGAGYGSRGRAMLRHAPSHRSHLVGSRGNNDVVATESGSGRYEEGVHWRSTLSVAA
jgi:hypothetical protein